MESSRRLAALSGNFTSATPIGSRVLVTEDCASLVTVSRTVAQKIVGAPIACEWSDFWDSTSSAKYDHSRALTVRTVRCVRSAIFGRNSLQRSVKGRCQRASGEWIALAVSKSSNCATVARAHRGRTDSHHVDRATLSRSILPCRRSCAIGFDTDPNIARRWD